MKKIAIVTVAAAIFLSVGSAGAQQAAKPERDNKSGEVRGRERADQVKQLNDQKSSKDEAKKSQGKADKKP
ncbi:MAG: hypothetical protein ING44_11540 [Telmatospirillum sp.]|nr:hypothetical protein [Telmatospirillum sp.]